MAMSPSGRRWKARESCEDGRPLIVERIRDLRRQDEDNLLGHLVRVETDQGKLSDEEILSFCRLLLIAGNETTTGLIIRCVRVFHEYPEVFVRLKEDPELIPDFIEETLRFFSPFTVTIRRAVSDLELAGVTIRKNEIVLPLIASANPDETVFTDA